MLIYTEQQYQFINILCINTNVSFEVRWDRCISKHRCPRELREQDGAWGPGVWYRPWAVQAAVPAAGAWARVAPCCSAQSR